MVLNFYTDVKRLVFYCPSKIHSFMYYILRTCLLHIRSFLLATVLLWCNWYVYTKIFILRHFMYTQKFITQNNKNTRNLYLLNTILFTPTKQTEHKKEELEYWVSSIVYTKMRKQREDGIIRNMWTGCIHHRKGLPQGAMWKNEDREVPSSHVS